MIKQVSVMRSRTGTTTRKTLVASKLVSCECINKWLYLVIVTVANVVDSI